MYSKVAIFVNKEGSGHHRRVLNITARNIVALFVDVGSEAAVQMADNDVIGNDQQGDGGGAPDRRLVSTTTAADDDSTATSNNNCVDNSINMNTDSTVSACTLPSLSISTTPLVAARPETFLTTDLASSSHLLLPSYHHRRSVD